MAGVLRWTGTWLPSVLLALIGLTLWRELTAELTWERPSTYFIGMISLSLGTWAVLPMVRLSRREFASVFLVTLMY